MLEGPHRSLLLAPRTDPQRLQRLQHSVWLEVIHVHADMPDVSQSLGNRRAGLRAARGATTPAEHDESDRRSDRESERRTLTRTDADAEEALIELVRSVRIGAGIGEVADVFHGHQSFFRRGFRR